MHTLMVGLLLAGLPGGGGAAQAKPAAPPDAIRLYIFTIVPPPDTKPTEAQKADLKERIQAVADIQKWYRDKRKQTISVVDGKDLADVVVEITAVQVAPGMSLAERTSGYLHGPRYDAWTVRAKVTAGTFMHEASHQGQFPSIAAEGVADDIGKWTQTNRKLLLEARPKGR